MDNFLDGNRQDEIVAEIKQVIHDEAMRKYSDNCDLYAIKTAPHLIYGAIVSKDGNMYCCLLGGDLQSGIAGFGETPKKACEAFDKAWNDGE